MKNFKFLLIGAMALLTLNCGAMITNFNTTPIETPAVTLTEAKAQLRIEPDFDVDNAQIQGMIAAAQDYCQRYTGRPLGQTMAFDLDYFDNISNLQCLAIPSVTTLQYLTDAGYVDLAPENYTFKNLYKDGLYSLAFVGTLPVLPVNSAAVKVLITTTAPPAIKTAMLLIITDLYERRDNRTVDEANTIALSYLRPYKQNW